jgi:tRNA(fMet)-specific endonuclease VapC
MMLTGNVEVLPFDELASMAAGRLRALLAAAGTPIGHFDTLIAGHALSLNLTLVTQNVKHFAQVPGLKIANWLE